jgi:hypothetical protein
MSRRKGFVAGIAATVCLGVSAPAALAGVTTCGCPCPPPPPVKCKPGWGFGDKNHCHFGPPGIIFKN